MIIIISITTTTIIAFSAIRCLCRGSSGLVGLGQFWNPPVAGSTPGLAKKVPFCSLLFLFCSFMLGPPGPSHARLLTHVGPRSCARSAVVRSVRGRLKTPKFLEVVWGARRSRGCLAHPHTGGSNSASNSKTRYYSYYWPASRQRS